MYDQMYAHITEDRPKPRPEAFPGILGRIVRALDPWTDADPMGMLTTAISKAAVMLEGRAKVFMGGKYRSPQVNTFLFGDSAIGAKGTSNAYTDMIFNLAFPDWGKRHLMVGAPSSGVGLVKRIANMAVAANHIIPTDELEPELWEEAEKHPIKYLMPSFPVLVYEEEFAKVLQRAKMDDTYEPTIRTMWQGGDVTAKISANATATLVSPVTSWVVHITPDEFLAKLGRASLAGGTFNRFVILYVKRTRELAWEDPVPDEILTPLAEELRDRINWALTKAWDEGDKDCRMEYSEAYKEYYINYVHPPYNAMLNGEKSMRQFAGRARDYVKLLSAIFAILDYRTVIEPRDLEAAKAIMDYSLESIPIIQQELGEKTADRRVYIDGNADEAKPDTVEWLRDYLIRNGATPKGKLTTAARDKSWTAQDVNNAIVRLNGDVYCQYETGKVRNRPTIMVEWIGPTDATEEPERVAKPLSRPALVETRPRVSQPPRKAVRAGQGPQRKPTPTPKEIDILEDW